MIFEFYDRIIYHNWFLKISFDLGSWHKSFNGSDSLRITSRRSRRLLIWWRKGRRHHLNGSIRRTDEIGRRPRWSWWLRGRSNIYAEQSCFGSGYRGKPLVCGVLIMQGKFSVGVSLVMITDVNYSLCTFLSHDYRGLIEYKFSYYLPKCKRSNRFIWTIQSRTKGIDIRF